MKSIFLIAIVAVAMIGMGVIPVHGEVLEKQADAAILVMIDDLEFLFYTSEYQMQDPHIFFSDGDGNTIHRYHDDATMELLFNSMDVGIEDQCYVFPKSTGYASDHFCVNDDYSLKYFINGKPVSGILDYIIQDNDRILIIFGNETDKQIQEYFSQLNSIKIKSGDAEIRVAESQATNAAQATNSAQATNAAQDLTDFLILGGIVIVIILLVIVLVKRKNIKSNTSPSPPVSPPPSTPPTDGASTIFFYECPKCHSGDIQNNPDGSVNCPDCGYRG